jgi:3-oxoacyl-[acyl-carrier-protein] synthase III
MKHFVKRHDRIVLPFNFLPELDFTLFDGLADLEAAIRRDFEEKAPAETEIVARLDAGGYATRYPLLRDVASNLLLTGRYAITMYERHPVRWRDVPRQHADVFMPRVETWDRTALAEAIGAGYRRLSATWDARAEDLVFGILLEVFQATRSGTHGDVQAINSTVGEALAEPGRLVYRLEGYTPDHPRYSEADMLAYRHPVPELEALMRHAMVLHDESPWAREQMRVVAIGDLAPDDVVVTLRPRTPEIRRFIGRARAGASRTNRRSRPATPRPPMAPVPAVQVRRRFTVMPRLEALAVYKGECVFTNEDLVRNAAYCWSPMTADEIRAKTGIAQRVYSELDLETMALLAAEAALDKSGRRPEEISAVIVCSCTSTRGCPSIAAWLSGQLGMLQTHWSCDLVAACAGWPYGLAEATRLLQETERPVLVVSAEKFSDKLGTVRASRMLFGDAAAAVVVAPAARDAGPDIEVFQTYASGPISEVESIIWPNPEFDDALTVYGPEVQALVRRYLAQMVTELRILPDPDGTRDSLLDAVELIVPHQANKTMVTRLAREAGIPVDRMYFDIERVGNTSAASIPVALHDAVRDGVITRPTRVFAPGFGAGAVAGYVVTRVDPAIAA